MLAAELPKPVPARGLEAEASAAAPVVLPEAVEPVRAELPVPVQALVVAAEVAAEVVAPAVQAPVVAAEGVNSPLR